MPVLTGTLRQGASKRSIQRFHLAKWDQRNYENANMSKRSPGSEESVDAKTNKECGVECSANRDRKFISSFRHVMKDTFGDQRFPDGAIVTSQRPNIIKSSLNYSFYSLEGQKKTLVNNSNLLKYILLPWKQCVLFMWVNWFEGCSEETSAWEIKNSQVLNSDQ